MTKNNKLIKIVYFDEQAAFDILQIYEKGDVLRTIKEETKKMGLLEANGEVKAGISHFFKMGLKGNAKWNKNTIAENQITSTLISEFVQHLDKDKINLTEIKDPDLKIQENSNAYYRNLLPIIHMIKDFSKLDIDTQTQKNLNSINFDKFGESLDKFSSYYEIQGNYNNHPAIFRFNIDGLRNNYTLFDLIKVSELKLYGVKIGETDSLDLTFQKVLDDLSGDDNKIPESFDETASKKEKTDNKFPIIDIVLAGVKE